MVRCRKLGSLALATGFAVLASGCVVRASTPATATVYTSGTVHTSAAIAVDTSATYTVSNYPPAPYYETITVSPGYGYVWIDGYWSWNGNDWGWVGGRWVPGRGGYIYVAPYYDYYGGRYVYRAGYWSRRDRLPRNVQVREYRDGRPAVYVPTVRDDRARRYHEVYVRDRSYRPPPTRDHRTPDSDRFRDTSDSRYERRPPPESRPPVRDHRSPTYDPPPPVRDHRSPTYDPPPPVRDKRSPESERRAPTRDKRQPAHDKDRDKDDDRDRDDSRNHNRRGDR